MTRITLVALAAGLAVGGPASAAGFKNVVVFGDSLSDVGNVYEYTSGAIPAAPYYDGRWSNGRLWVEHVAGVYGVALTPSGEGPTSFGNDWAYGGAATTVDATFQITSTTTGTVPSLKHQVKDYLKTVLHKADPTTLYVIWGGGNDVQYSLLAENGAASPQAMPATYANTTVAIVTALKAAGAKSFLIPNVPDVGLTPDAVALGATAAADATALSKALNAAAAAALADPLLTAGITIYGVNVFKVMDDIVDGTTNFNFTATDYGVTVPCITGAGSTPCPDPDHTFFWDGFHPTAFAHADVAVEAARSLPKP